MTIHVLHSFSPRFTPIYLVLEFPSVSSRSSETHSSWILSPSHGFTSPAALLPNANSAAILSAIGTSAVWSMPAGTAGEHVPLCPGVHIRDPAPDKASSLKPNGFRDTRLNVGDEGPLWGIWIPASQPESGRTWRPGLGGVDEGIDEGRNE